MTIPPTLTLTVDGAVVVYSALEQPTPGDPGLIAGGLLAGDPLLVKSVRRILTEPAVADRVCVAEPGLYYQFTPDRSSISDVAAAMLAAGNGRGQLCDLGWDVLLDTVDEDEPSGGIVH